MPVQLCPRCQRANPPEASYCYFDGTDIRLSPDVAAAGGGRLSQEFVFPSGQKCRTYEDFVRGCCVDWSASRRLLQSGVLKRFFGGIGRTDLAALADKLGKEPDLDAALDAFLERLSDRDEVRPHLNLSFRRIHLGKVKRGEVCKVDLVLSNAGCRLLRGTVTLEDEPWISFGPDLPRSLPIQTPTEQRIPLVIDTTTLIGGQKYATKVRVHTNGGAFEIPVQVEVAVVPFPHPPLDGATSARELARKMKDHPRESVPLLESGAVEKWFTLNGWRYPVQGPTARDVGAVQQFFESLGLSTPPPLTLSEKEIRLECHRGVTPVAQVVLSTAAKKWVFARIISENPWLVPLETDLAKAQRLTITFSVRSEELPLDVEQTGKLTIVANGGQKFEVVVRVLVTAPPRRVGSELLRGLTLGLVTAGTIRLLAALPDLGVRPLSEFGSWLVQAEPNQLQSYMRLVTLSLGWLGIVAGGYVAMKRSGLRDVLAGVVAGGVTGLILSGTCACLVVAGDSLFRFVVPLSIPGAAVLGWMLAGAILGTALAFLGERCRGILDRLARPLAWSAERFGLADFALFLRGY